MSWKCLLCGKSFGSRKYARDHCKKEHKKELKDLRNNNPDYRLSQFVGRKIE